MDPAARIQELEAQVAQLRAAVKRAVEDSDEFARSLGIGLNEASYEPGSVLEQEHKALAATNDAEKWLSERYVLRVDADAALEDANLNLQTVRDDAWKQVESLRARVLDLEKDRDSWKEMQCVTARKLEAVERSNAALRLAVGEVLSEQHVLQAALIFIRRWSEDPVFADKGERDSELERAVTAVSRWHKAIAAVYAVDAGKDFVPRAWLETANEWLEAARADVENAKRELAGKLTAAQEKEKQARAKLRDFGLHVAHSTVADCIDALEGLPEDIMLDDAHEAVAGVDVVSIVEDELEDL